MFDFRVFLPNETWTAYTVIYLFWLPKLPGSRSRSSGLHTVASLPPEHQGMEILTLRAAQKLRRPPCRGWRQPGNCTGTGSGFRGKEDIAKWLGPQPGCLRMNSCFLGGPVTSGKSLSLSVWFHLLPVSAVSSGPRVSMCKLFGLALLCTQQMSSIVMAAVSSKC